MAALERQVGVSLLERQGRRVVLTPAARLLVGRTERVLAELEAAEAELADGGVRLLVALPLLIWASTTLAGVAIAAAAIGGALAPLLSRDRGALRRVRGGDAPTTP